VVVAGEEGRASSFSGKVEERCSTGRRKEKERLNEHVLLPVDSLGGLDVLVLVDVLLNDWSSSLGTDLEEERWDGKVGSIKTKTRSANALLRRGCDVCRRKRTSVEEFCRSRGRECCMSAA